MKGGYMMKNKQGMSAVVTTLIIILLVIVALGIIWVVVRNVVQGGARQVELAQKCQEVEVQAVGIANTTANGTGYNLTLHRTGTGDDIGGVKVVFFNDDTNSEVIQFGEAIGVLGTVTKDLTLTTPVTEANKVEITVWFTSDAGGEDLCPTTRTDEF